MVQYWLPADRVNPGVWITVFLVLIIFINYFGVGFFGEFEFWLSSFKVVVIIGLILLSFILMLGGGPDSDRKGFRYWEDPGAFNSYIDNGPNGDGTPAGRFYAFWATMVSATFAYLGTELVGVTVGEAQNPRKTIPRAIKLTFYRIIFFYVISVLLVGTLVPYDSPELEAANAAETSSAASPFVLAIQLSHIPALPSILNACILLFVFSAANSDLYIATRTIYGLAKEGKAPKILTKTDRRGVPFVALGLCASIALISYMNVSSSSKTVFRYFVDLVSQFGLLSWISLLVTHISFVKAREAQQVPKSDLAYTAPLGIYGSYFALFWCIIVSLTKSFDVFTGDTFDYKTFITSYLGIPLYLILIFGYKFSTRCDRVKSHEADLWTDKDAIDREEAAYLAQREAQRAAQGEASSNAGWFYRTFVAWLF